MQIPVNADVAEAAMPIVVAKRAVVRGNVITAADVEVRTMEPAAKSAGQRASFDSIEKLIGMEAKQPHADRTKSCTPTKFNRPCW